jgi:hypothetical protein
MTEVRGGECRVEGFLLFFKALSGRKGAKEKTAFVNCSLFIAPKRCFRRKPESRPPNSPFALMIHSAQLGRLNTCKIEGNYQIFTHPLEGCKQMFTFSSLSFASFFHQTKRSRPIESAASTISPTRRTKCGDFSSTKTCRRDVESASSPKVVRERGKWKIQLIFNF